MGRHLHVLIVDDSEDDTLLMLRELRRGGYDPTFVRVDTAEAMDEAMENQRWDLVIADYVMPSFSGMAALELVKSKGIDLPFILVSGQIDEATVVAAIKAGAGGFVAKGNLARLVPAVERELRDAQVRRERREAEEALRKAYAELERRVKERTAELEQANSNLRVEIAERRRAEQELTAERQKREEFISVVAHDLRNALTSTRGFAQILAGPALQGNLPQMAQRTVEGIVSGTRRLDRMISDLLDVSRIEARQLTLARKPIDLPALVREIVQRTAELTKGHPVKVEVRGDIPQLEADPDRIEQVLSNLLSNAGKYSYPDTEITVEVERRADEVMVSATNHGRGVLPEDRVKLFTRFHRTKEAKEEKAPGLGLGLYIAKGLVEAHGGRIWVDSEPGKYATFRFVLPIGGPTG